MGTSLQEIGQAGVRLGVADERLVLVSGAQLAPPTDGPRDWSSYSTAQCHEKRMFKMLLYELCKTVPVETQANGRPRLPIEDVVFAAVYRSYVGLSSRRVMCDLAEIAAAGFIKQKPSYNAVTLRLRHAQLTPILQSLITGVAASFAHIETSFAVDSTGLRIPKVTKWYDEKYGWRERREWLKCHVSVGLKSHIIAAVEVTKRQTMDHAVLRPMIMRTADTFPVKGVAADSAYSIVSNLEFIEQVGAFPAVPFKSNANPFRHRENSLWRKLYHLFALNGDDWQAAINQQNQAESTFSMLKRKFGERVFSKDETGQINEVLCKVLCHNICVVLYWLYRFGVELPDTEQAG